MSRKLRISEDLIEKIAKYISEGNYVEVACAASGIGKTTYYRWFDIGEKSKSGIYREFRNAIKKAEADAETKYTGVIKDAANTGQWTAAAWWLERRYPERWGKREKLQVDANLTTWVDFVKGALSANGNTSDQ